MYHNIPLQIYWKVPQGFLPKIEHSSLRMSVFCLDSLNSRYKIIIPAFFSFPGNYSIVFPKILKILKIVCQKIFGADFSFLLLLLYFVEFLAFLQKPWRNRWSFWIVEEISQKFLQFHNFPIFYIIFNIS